MLWDEFVVDFYYNEDNNPVSQTTNTLEWYNKYLAPYLKVLKVEVPENDRDGKIALYFNDGSMVFFSASSWVFYPDARDFQATEFSDTMTDRDRTLCSKKYFDFFITLSDTRATLKYHYGKGVEPYMVGWDGDTEKLKTDSSLGCNVNATAEPAYCTKLIQMNNWKIPDDYPFKL